MAQIIAWSHSRIDTFKKCARQFHEVNILKTVPYTPSEPQIYGDYVHKELDKRLKTRNALPADLAHLEGLVVSIENAEGETLSEQKLTLNTKLRPAGWFDKDAYVRVIIDVAKINGSQMFLGDWKTGKIKFGEHQLKLFAATGFIFYPSVEQITTAYIWLRDKIVDPKVYHRDQLQQMWTELLQEPTRLQDYANRNYWPPRPGKHCGWCGVNKQHRCPDAAEKYRGG